MKKSKNKKHIKLIKNDSFGQNGGHHELRHEKIMSFEPGDVDFRAIATRFVNFFVFLKLGVDFLSFHSPLRNNKPPLGGLRPPRPHCKGPPRPGPHQKAQKINKKI